MCSVIQWGDHIICVHRTLKFLTNYTKYNDLSKTIPFTCVNATDTDRHGQTGRDERSVYGGEPAWFSDELWGIASRGSPVREVTRARSRDMIWISERWGRQSSMKWTIGRLHPDRITLSIRGAVQPPRYTEIATAIRSFPAIHSQWWKHPT